MSVLATLEKTTPHIESHLSYGYRFQSIDVYHVDWSQNLDVSDELKKTHDWHYIDIKQDSPHKSRIIWEIASHIEGNFGIPYEAIIVCRAGLIGIYTPKANPWWNAECHGKLSNYLMGLRALLNLLK